MPPRLVAALARQSFTPSSDPRRPLPLVRPATADSTRCCTDRSASDSRGKPPLSAVSCIRTLQIGTSKLGGESEGRNLRDTGHRHRIGRDSRPWRMVLRHSCSKCYHSSQENGVLPRSERSLPLLSLRGPDLAGGNPRAPRQPSEGRACMRGHRLLRVVLLLLLVTASLVARPALSYPYG
jgi:hypothetical protein